MKTKVYVYNSSLLWRIASHKQHIVSRRFSNTKSLLVDVDGRPKGVRVLNSFSNLIFEGHLYNPQRFHARLFIPQTKVNAKFLINTLRRVALQQTNLLF